MPVQNVAEKCRTLKKCKVGRRKLLSFLRAPRISFVLLRWNLEANEEQEQDQSLDRGGGTEPGQRIHTVPTEPGQRIHTVPTQPGQHYHQQDVGTAFFGVGVFLWNKSQVGGLILILNNVFTNFEEEGGGGNGTACMLL